MTVERHKMLAKLHVLKKHQGLSDEDYRAKLMRLTGHDSAASLTNVQLQSAVASFHNKQKANNSYTAKLKALYLAAYNLGGLDDGSDAAIDAFIARQTGKLKIQFLTAADANSVTEALKRICARHGFVVPGADKAGHKARQMLIEAQWTRLGELGQLQIPNEFARDRYISARYLGFSGSLTHMTTEQLDRAARDLGRWIRKAQAAKNKAASA